MVKAMRPKGLAPPKGAGPSRTFRPWKVREDALLLGTVNGSATTSASRVPPPPPTHLLPQRGRRVAAAASATEERVRSDQKRRSVCGAAAPALAPSSTITSAFTLAHAHTPSTSVNQFPFLNALLTSDSFASTNSCAPQKRIPPAKVTPSSSICVQGRRPVASDAVSRRSVRSSGARSGVLGGVTREVGERGGIAKGGPLKKRFCSRYGSQYTDAVTATFARETYKINKGQITFKDPKVPHSHIACKQHNKGLIKNKPKEVLQHEGKSTPQVIQEVTTKHIPIEEQILKSTQDLVNVFEHETEKNNRIAPHKIQDDFEWEEIRKDKFSTSWETLDEEELVPPKDESKSKNVLKSTDKPNIPCKGWEEVVFSVHVHVPQHADPNATVLPIAQVHPSQKHSLSRKRRKFETASEILVLPILARKHFNNDVNILNPSKQSLNPLNQVIDNFSTNGQANISCQLISKVDSSTRILSADTVSFRTAHSPSGNSIKCVTTANDVSFSKKIKDTISENNDESLSSNELKCEIVQTINESTKLLSSSQGVDKSKQDDSCDLRVHQQEFVKIVHEMELMTKRDVSTSTHSMASKGMVVEAIHKVKSFSDLSPNSSIASMSFSITKSFVCQDKVSTGDDGDLRTFVSEDNNRSLSHDSKGYSSDGDEPFENRLPILLHENKKVRNILEKVVSKLEEANERVGIKIMKKFKNQGRVQEDLFTHNECGKVSSVVMSEESKNNGSNLQPASSDILYEVNKKEKYFNYLGDCDGDKCVCEIIVDDEISEVDTKHSARHDSDSDAVEGDDEAEDAQSWSDCAAGEEGERSAEDGQTQEEQPPGEEPPRESCRCLEATSACVRHPSRSPSAPGSSGEALCDCPRFNDTCPTLSPRVEGMRPSDDYSSDSSTTMPSSLAHSSAPLSILAGSAALSADASPAASNPTSAPVSAAPSASASVAASSVRSLCPSASAVGRRSTPAPAATVTSPSPSNSQILPYTYLDPEVGSKHSMDDDWIPWTRDDDTGGGIPAYSPSKENTVSIITLPPKYAPKAMDIFQSPQDETLSDCGDKAPVWVPDSLLPDNVPETISEFHWMPDGVRGFSSTMITPEVSEMKGFEGGPVGLSRDNSYSPGTTDSSTFRGSKMKPDGAFYRAGSPDAPPIIGSELIQVITSAVERGLAPLRISIDEIRDKIEKLETCGNNALKPDILVGVSAAPQCVEQKCSILPHGKPNYKCFSGGEAGNSRELSMSPYVMVRQQFGEAGKNLGVDSSEKNNFPQRVQDSPQQTIGLQTDDNERRFILPPCPDEKCKKSRRILKSTNSRPNKCNSSQAFNASENVAPFYILEEDEKLSSETTLAPPQFRDEVQPGTVPRIFADDTKGHTNENSEYQTQIKKTIFSSNNQEVLYDVPNKEPLEDRSAPGDKGFSSVNRPERCKGVKGNGGGTDCGASGRVDGRAGEVPLKGVADRTGSGAGGVCGALRRVPSSEARPSAPLPSHVRIPLCKCSPTTSSKAPPSAPPMVPPKVAPMTPPMVPPMASSMIPPIAPPTAPPKALSIAPPMASPLAPLLTPSNAPLNAPPKAPPMTSLKVTQMAPPIAPLIAPTMTKSSKTLSPIAQMYLDLSKSKHAWAVGGATGAGPAGPEGRRPYAGGAGAAKGRDEAHTQRVTLAFSGDVSPLIDISLTSQGKVVVGGNVIGGVASAAARPVMRTGGSTMSFPGRRSLPFYR